MSSLFTDEELTNLEINNTDNTPVTVLGKTFANDTERRQYFRDELRKKLPELKKLEGYPIGEDDDIINLSDPPYYTACLGLMILLLNGKKKRNLQNSRKFVKTILK